MIHNFSLQFDDMLVKMEFSYCWLYLYIVLAGTEVSSQTSDQDRPETDQGRPISDQPGPSRCRPREDYEDDVSSRAELQDDARGSDDATWQHE